MSQLEIKRNNTFRDILGVAGFIAAVVLGTLFLNTYAFRSYNVVGSSMEDTLHDQEKIIVNRLPVTWALLQNHQYMPERGQIIVFELNSAPGGNQNTPKLFGNWANGDEPTYLVKRVIGLPGDRVVVKDGQMTVFNNEHPDGFDPDDLIKDEPRSPIFGDINEVVPEAQVFVVGDHRDGAHNSHDSRTGLGTIPLYSVIGPVSLRTWPISKLHLF